MTEASVLEPVPVVAKRWKCPHCGRTHARKARAAEHIARCWKNPAVRACLSCANYGAGEYYADDEQCEVGAEPWHQGDDGRSRLTTGCPLWKHVSGEYDGPFIDPPADPEPEPEIEAGKEMPF